MNDLTPLPISEVESVESFVDGCFRDVAKASNVELLDESQVWNLHRLAEQLYAAGYADGTRAEHERERRKQSRRTDRRLAQDATQT